VIIIKKFLYLLFYKIILEFIYVNTHSKLFAYAGYVCNYNILRYLLAFLMFVICALIMPKKENKISNIFNLIIFMLSIVPMLILFAFGNYYYWIILSCVACFILQSIIIRLNISFTKIKGINYTNDLLRKGVFLFTILLIGVFFVQYGLPNFKNMGFYNISETRATFSYKSVGFNLLIGLFCRILNPIMIAISFKEHKKFNVAILILIQVYIYSITGFKTYLFIPAVVLVIQYIKSERFFSNIALGLTSCVGLAYLAFLFLKDNMIIGLIHNRVIFFPALIKYAYFDFFSNNEYIFFSQNSLSKIFGIQSSYTESVPNIIAKIYFDKPSMYANTGYIADGFANLGIFGMFIMTIILAIILNYVDSISSKEKMPYLIALFIPYAISLNDGALIMTLFSGGMLLVIFIFMVIDFTPRKKFK